MILSVEASIESESIIQAKESSFLVKAYFDNNDDDDDDIDVEEEEEGFRQGLILVG